TIPEEQVTDDDSDLPRGTVERIAPIPDGPALAGATAQVAALNLLPTTEFDKTCEPSLSRFKHVILVLKENKTFDAYFGDFPGAEASRDFLEWGEQVTPNQHALARQFCLLDNFYVESEQSVEGHFWATAQTTTDYFERTWAAPWGGHVIAPMPLPPGGLTPLDSPANGFIFDALAAAHVPYTSYGEFVGAAGDLSSHINLSFVDFPTNFLARADTEKLPVFLAALNAGKLDPFTFIALQYDHTFGLEPGKPTPDSMIADNDLATGRLVEAVSHSPYWSDTLILITEDDPSGSADHVDSHRSFALVVSPWAQRGKVSHVRGSFPSLAATYERALGVQPLNALDAQAEPLWDCLSGTSDATPFSALPANVAPALNPSMPRARVHDFSAVDRAKLGVELWRHARPDAPPPKALLDEDDDD
ncbi:MAG TPA: alkaline phosphatase family protein, partial [Myxococcales bacterium]|nr:alkaline phosphatase family protein [Myxococcales bacterium]